MPTEPVPSPIEGVRIWRPQVHADSRGRFVEVFRTAAVPEPLVQSNHSRSAAGVLRGLHYHRHQADLWYLVSGRAQVGLADLRTRGSAPVTHTFVLDGETPTAVYVPTGVAHGYLALTEIDLIYWVTREYDPADENGVAWDDPTLAIAWQIDAAPVVSERDASNPALEWDLIPAFS
jgi:dTDP-4-dehydrorhamnose 3,5-epimerase